MKKALLYLLCMSFVVPSFAANPTVTVTPSTLPLPAGSTQQLTAAFSDGSQIQSCTWMATGSQNGIQSIGVNTATFAAGTLKATYVVTASCTNAAGVRAMGIAVIAVV